MISVRTEAEILARALEIGALSIADAVAWADAVIEREEHPDAAICEVATSGRRYEPDVVAALREVPGTFDEAQVSRNLVRVLADGLQRDRGRADQVARALYQLALSNEVHGEPLRQIAWWAWDALDLADAGIIAQTRDQVIDELVDALRTAVEDHSPERRPA